MYDKYSIVKEIVTGSTASVFHKCKGFVVTNSAAPGLTFSVIVNSGSGTTSSIGLMAQGNQSKVFELEISGMSLSLSAAFSAYTLF